ncbi:MAG: ribbon-helix-helix protein, CopG family [Candidatus Wildermuthbacteria bacterium]|nr:ribbon-helix-helix protein, CopG family [Candidatus Wildermuthbacteria bacterium]
MRSIINISLPGEFNEIIEKEVKKRRYASKSEFFRALLRAWIEGRLLSDLHESKREFEAGKGKLLRSLADLD